MRPSRSLVKAIVSPREIHPPLQSSTPVPGHRRRAPLAREGSVMASATSAADVLDTRELLNVLTAVRKGDFSVRMPTDYTGIAGKIADTLNDIIEHNDQIAREPARVTP